MKQTKENTPDSGIVQWESPSNIALVKYWGKSDIQIPKNPSISFTLQEAKTITRLEWKRKNTSRSQVEFDFRSEERRVGKERRARWTARVSEQSAYGYAKLSRCRPVSSL